MVESIASIEVLTRFAKSLIGSAFATKVKVTPSGLFVPETELSNLILLYQSWLKSDSGAAGTLEDQRCLEHMFGTMTPIDYYILDGKNCVVGFLVKIDSTPEIKSKLPIYAGTPIDGRSSIHPKDPILTMLPEGVHLDNGPDGMELRIELRNFMFQLPLSRLQDLAYLIGNSPRLRKHKNTFRQSQRRILSDVATLIRQARQINHNNLRFIPSQFRRRSDVKYLMLSDLIFALTSHGKYICGFGFKAKNLLIYLQQEIKVLCNTVRTKRIGELDLRFADRRLAGTLNSKQERFSLEYQALMDFVQIYRPQSRSNHKTEATTLFDIIRELSLEFSRSSWTLERDISPRYRGSSKDNLNYRTTKGWVFWISKRSHLVSLRRRPIIQTKNIIINPTQQNQNTST